MATISKYTNTAGKTLYRVSYRTPEHKQTTKRGFKTKKAAQDFAATVHVSKLRGEFIDASEARVTVGELGPAWLARQTHLKPSSTRTVEVAWRVHVEPRWSGVRLADIRHSAVQQWVSDMGRESGPVTVVRAYGVLAAVLDEAVNDRRLIANPARGVKLPKKVKAERAYLSHAQVGQLAAEAGDKGSLVLLLAYTGLRWGEAAGLRVKDLDLLRRRVKVAQNAVSVGAEVVVGTPKTHHRRVVPVPAFVADRLGAVCSGKGPDDLLFPNRTGGYAKPPGANTWFSGAVERCQAAAEKLREAEKAATGEAVTPVFPRVTAHALRHTAVSLAISAGANVKAIQKMLGHASAAMTLDTYADLFDDDLDAVADALDAAVSGASVVRLVSNAT